MSFFSRKPKFRRTPSPSRPQSRERMTASPRVGSLRRKFFRGISAARGFLIFFLLLVVLGGILASAQYFTIRNIRIAREDERLDLSAFSAAIRGIVGKNLFAVSTISLRSSLLKSFPAIERLEISRVLPDTLLFRVATATPHFWVSCEESKKAIDEEGNIVEKKITKNVAFTARGAPLPNVDPKTEMFVFFEKEGCPDFSRRIFSSSRLEEILDAKRELEKVAGQTVVRAGYYRAAREIHFYLENETAIWFDFLRPLSEQIDEFRVALALYPKLGNALDHIDVRISGKIFYAPKK